MSRGAWWTAVHRVTKSRTPLKRLNTHTHPYTQDPSMPPLPFLPCEDMEQEVRPQQAPNLPVSFFKKSCSFIWLHQALVAAQRNFDLHCGMQGP